MSSANRPASSVSGSQEFTNFYRSLEKGSEERVMLDHSLDALKQNLLLGDKVPKDRWPKKYIQTYRINNLWKLDLPKGARLVYTVLNREGRWIVIVLECFLAHKDYAKRFGYD